MTWGRWQARRLLESSHRLGFSAAAALLAASAIGWLAWLLWPAAGRGAALPAATAHGLVFVFGFMPLFFAGFLFTVGPRWRGEPPDAAREAALTRRLAPPLAAYALAWLAWWPAWFAAPETGLGARAALATLVVAALAWSIVVFRLRRLARQDALRDSPHLRHAARACAVGASLLWACAAALAAQAWAALHALTQAGLWLFCGGVFACASHRMLPLDTSVDRPGLARRHPLWLLAVMGTALGAQGLDLLAAAVARPLPPAWHAAQAILAAGTAVLLARIAWRWARLRKLGRQLVAMLHAGFVWLALALALQAAAHGLAALGAPGRLGLAPLHALALGWMGSTLFAMASRVAGSLGGQALAADRWAWGLFTLVQAAALARLAAALWPAAPGWLATAAAAAWALAGTGWLIVYGRWLGLPRRSAAPFTPGGSGRRGSG